MSLAQQTSRVLSLFEDARSFRSLLTWPKFSLTSFLMVSRLAKQQIRPKTVIDVGANVGQFAVASAKLFPGAYIHCFEPNPESVKELEKNIATLPNVYVHPIALGDRATDVQFHVNTYSPASSILSLGFAHKNAYPSAQEKSVITVKLSTLDDALSGLSLRRPVMLKIDVQGYEAKTLTGAKKTLEQVDYVLVETSFKPMYEGDTVFGEISTIMADEGFVFARPIDFAFAHSNGEITHIDALFVKDSD